MAGDTASNCGGPWFHADPSGAVLDVRVGFHYQPVTGSVWVSPAPIPVSVYVELHAAAWLGHAAFVSEIATTAWGAWFASYYTDPYAAQIFRRLVAATPPRVSVADVPVPP